MKKFNFNSLVIVLLGLFSGQVLLGVDLLQGRRPVVNGLLFLERMFAEIKLHPILFRLLEPCQMENRQALIAFLTEPLKDHVGEPINPTCSICGDKLIPSGSCFSAYENLILPFKCNNNGKPESLISHVLHKECYGKWLASCLGNNMIVSCPLCKSKM